MKTQLLFTIVAVLFSMAFNDPYTEAMKKGIELLNSAGDQNSFLSASNHFARIAESENKEWLPAYYAGYSMTIAAAMEAEGSKKDDMLDAAQLFLDKAAKLEHTASEVLAVEGFIHMLRIGVDPATRGPEYSAKSSAALQKAKAMDPDNPRVQYLLAQLNFGTAQFFGSDGSEACRMNDGALDLFGQEAADNSRNNLEPTWGQNMAQEFKSRCESMSRGQ